jgi:hypothetical protein
MHVIITLLSCLNISFLSQKLSLQRVRKCSVYAEHGNIYTILKLVRIVYV